MKKIVLIILVTFLFIPNIKSLSWTNKIPKNKPIIIYEEKVKYKWYKLNKVNERVIGALSHNCKYFDEVESNYSEWLEEKPNEVDNRTIEEKEIILNNEYEFIIMENFLAQTLTVKEIKITNKNKEKIPYTLIQCNSCDVAYDNYKYLNDEDLNTAITINNKSLFLLKLDKKYTENFRIELYYEKENIVFGWTTRLTLKVNDTIKRMDFNRKNLYYVYSSSYLSYVMPINTNWVYDDSNIKKLYRFKDDYVSCYDYKKEYLNGYFTSVDHYIKDETSKTIFYKYELVEIQNEDKIEENLFEESHNEESLGLIDNEIETLAINYGSKKESRNYSMIPIFIIALGGILVLLILICKKMRLNIKESR